LEEKVEYISFNPKDILDYIVKQRHDIMYYTDCTEFDVFLGPIEFTQAADLTRKISNWDTRISVSGPVNGKLVGCNVRLVPNMTGVLVVPKN
jgi:hypothetical protein